MHKTAGVMISKVPIEKGQRIFEVNTEKYAEGVYFVRVINGNNIVGTQKLIITR